jgi:serine protease Do
MIQLQMSRPALAALGLAALGFFRPAAATAGAAAAADIRRDPVVEAVERVMPSVVNIGTVTLIERHDPMDRLLREFYGPFYRRRPPEAAYSLGSGVIIDESGFLLTNEHVVRQASRIRVKLGDGREFDAEHVASLEGADIALVRLSTKSNETFTAVKFARDDDLLLGETVISLGNPFGLGGSVSRGILSSKARRPPKESEPLDVGDWLQTDAPINFGNSGGPLVNVRGELIGLNVARSSEGEGIGFAIPIKRVNQALAEMFTPEGVKSLWFGARLRAGANTVVVTQVEPASPAAKGGLRAGDAITQINHKPASDLVAFNRELIAAEDKRDVPLLVQRGNEQKTLTVRLVPEHTVFNADLIKKKTGASLQPLTAEAANRLRLEVDEGLLVTAIEGNSPAAEAGLERGVVLRAVDSQPANDLTAVARLLHTKKRGDTVVLNVLGRVQFGNVIETRTANVKVTVR